jgi:tRNA (guanine37-N1)-methyltransferase
MKAGPILRAVDALKANGPVPYVIYTSPQGEIFDNARARELSRKERLLFICGRYEGIDERVMSIVDEELSIGDFVLSGGEIPVLLMVEAISRFVPGVVGDMESVVNDSFYRDLLDHPHYTRPRNIRGLEVPDVLLSGDHEKIEIFRRKKSLERTMERRPDIFLKHELDLYDKKAILSLFEELRKNVE